MAAPNIANPTTIIGKTAVLAVTTSATNILSNSAGSNKVFRVNALYISNIDGTNNADITAVIRRSSVDYAIASTITVPADATLEIIGPRAIYLEEGDDLRLTANANNDLVGVCSYEDIS